MVALERRPSHHHLVKHGPQGPDVGPVINALSPHLFRAHVGDRPHRGAGSGKPGLAGDRRQSEIYDLHDPVPGQDRVGGLDVPMDDALPMCPGQTLPDPDGDIEGFGKREGAPSDLLPDRLPLAVGHGEEGAAVVGFADLVQGADIGVVEGRGRPGLAQETCPILVSG